MARAFFASMIATAIVSALLYANIQTNFLPDFDFLTEIQMLNERLGFPSTMQAAWITHAVVGVVVLGLMFAFIQPILPGSAAGEGLWFGIVTALLSFTVMMPLAGNAVFAQDQDVVFIAALIAFNLVYGLIIAVSFDALSPSDA